MLKRRPATCIVALILLATSLCAAEEGQWFSPHQTSLGRAPGWNTWTFEFNAGKVVVERDGKRLDPARLTPARFIPSGAVALVFLGPEAIGDPEMWIDDVTVSFPVAAKP